MAAVQIVYCDYSAPKHLDALSKMVNAYIGDEMGGGDFLPETKQADLIKGLKNHPKSIVLFAQYKTSFVGFLVAFENFSTFTAKPMLNVHDVFVMPEHRGKGIGKRLMNTIIAEAETKNCSRITLEVRKDNFTAQNLYIDLGFDESEPEMFYWLKKLIK